MLILSLTAPKYRTNCIANLRALLDLIHRQFWPSPGFLAGAALASPFLADVISWRFAGWLVVFWAIGGGLYLRNITPSLRNPLLLLPIAILATHLLALAISETPFAASVLKESLLAVVMLAIALASKIDAKFQVGFFAVVVGTALGTAALGLLKLGLQDRGYLLWFIIKQCPARYPQGSNLCTDYNLLGMLWLVAAIGSVAWRVQSRSWASVLFICLFIAAGLAVGSRRFLTLVAIIPILWISLASMGGGWRRSGPEAALAVMVCIAGWLLVSAVSDPISFERFRFGAEPWTVVGAPERIAVDARSPNRAGASVIAGTIFSEGLGSRFDRWYAGGALFLRSPVIGYGFGYHEPFANAFVGGAYRDHPHLPLLSEALIGGIPLLLVCLLFYTLLFLRMLKRSACLQVSGLPACFFVVTAVSAISGDTLFSIPQWLSMALALALASGSKTEVEL